MSDVYTRDILQDIDEMQALLPLPDARVYRVLRRLERAARASADDQFLGFVSFHYANACLSRNEQERAHQYIRQAIEHLIRTDDVELLARTCNLFAVDAQFNGCYDIAHNYFNMALALLQDMPDSLVHGILEANLGNLLTETGNYAAANRYIRRATPLIRRYSEDMLADQNTAVACINIGMNELYLGHTKKASVSLRRAQSILERAAVEETIQLTYLLFLAHYHFATGQSAQMLAAVTEIAKRTRKGILYNDFLYDLYNFCQRLLASGEMEAVRRILEAAKKGDPTGTSAYRRLLLSELEVDFYTLQGNRKMLDKSFRQQHHLSLAHADAQNRMYLHSVQLLLRITEWRREQEAYRAENRKLRRLAEQDTLTGLPNRYALNRALEEGLLRAQRNGHRFGIGIVDVDAFKRYNDLYGHAQGDQCLRLVADVLRRAGEEHHLFVARYGGDEFVLLYENMTDSQILRLAAGLERQMPVRISHGFVNVLPDETSRSFDLLARADAAMYQVKKGRR